MLTVSDFGNTVLLKDRVYEALKADIILGNLAPGEKLNILELANKMNISCAPVREALNILSKDGLVILAPHRQATVAQGSYNEYMTSFALRKMVEPYAAKISTPLIPQERIDEARVILSRVLETPEDVAQYVESDSYVHDMLYCHSGSQILTNVMNQIKTCNMCYRYKVEKSESDAGAQVKICLVATMEHVGIIDALDSRDAERVYNTVLKHIENSFVRNKPAETN